MRKIVLAISFVAFSLGLFGQAVDSVEVVDPLDLDTLTAAQIFSDSAVMVLKAPYDFYQKRPSFFLQAADSLLLSGTTLYLSLQNDNTAASTVDLSSLQDGTGTDDQTVDSLLLSGTTLILALENDGEAPYTVDLSSLAAGSSYQTVDSLLLSGTTLILALENDGEAPYTVDLAGLQDGTGTDDQTVDSLILSGSTLILALEDDSEAPYTLDLSPINTDNQTVDTFSLSGTTLTLALEDDGEAPYTVDLSSLSGGGGSVTGDTISVLVIGNSIAHNTTDTTNNANYRFSQRAYTYDYRHDSLAWLVIDTSFNGGAPLNFPPQLIGNADGFGVDRVPRNATYGSEVIFNYLDANRDDYVYALSTGRGGKSLEDSLLAFTYYTDSIFAHIAEAAAANSKFGYFDYVLLGGYPGEDETLEAVVLAFKDSLDALGYTDHGTTWFMNDAPTTYTVAKWNSQLYEILANNGQFVTAYGYQDSTAAGFDGVHPTVAEIQEYGKSAYKAIFEGRGNQAYAATNWKLNTGQDLSASAYDGWVLTIDSAANEVKLAAPAAGGGAGTTEYYFGARDTSTTTLTASAWTDLTWDTEIKNDASFTHASGSAEITLDSSGIYLITIHYRLNIGTGRDDVFGNISVDTGGGYSIETYMSEGSIAFDLTPSVPEFGTCLSNYMYSATAGDKIKAQVLVNTSSDWSLDASSITIQRIE